MLHTDKCRKFRCGYIEAGGLIPRIIHRSVETRETFQVTGFSTIQVRVK